MKIFLKPSKKKLVRTLLGTLVIVIFAVAAIIFSVTYQIMNSGFRDAETPKLLLGIKLNKLLFSFPSLRAKYMGLFAIIYIALLPLVYIGESYRESRLKR